MKRIAVILAFSLVGVFAHAQKTLSSVQVSPHGAAMQSGTLQYSVACQYTDGSTDNCPGDTVTWYSSQPTLATVSSTGLVSYVGNCGSGTTYWDCWTNIAATVNGFSDYGTIVLQYPTDVFQVILTPGQMSIQPAANGASIANNLVVGATATFGAGDGDNGSLPYTANPFPGCNWSSSNPSVGTITRYGLFTAVSVGTSVVSCVTAGNAAYSAAPPTYTVTVVAGTASGNTWYVRPDGGTPYTNSANTPLGQCNGQANAPYPGSGVNQPCAFGDFEDLYFDQTTGNRQWVISGGDTVIVYPKTGGYDTAIISVSGSTVTPTNCGGDSTYCDVPDPPSGTTSQPTRILGSNYANCTGSYGPNPADTTLLLGYGRELLDLTLAQNIDVECFELADGSSTTGFEQGINIDAFASNVTLKNLFIHNATSAGIYGAATVGLLVDHVHIRAAEMVGFEMDDAFTTSGFGISNVSTSSGLVMTNSEIEFTGCREIYGSTAEYPFIANSCIDDLTGGYGDGLGTGSMTGNWYYDSDIFRYNFQDGLDNLHSGAQSETIINSQAYGNEGNQFKFGDVDTGIFQNDFALGNCNRVQEPFNGVTIAKSGGNPCRAGGPNLLVEWANTGSYVFQNNTLIGVGNGVFQYQCESSWANCSSASVVYENNIVAGYTDSDPIYSSGSQPNGLGGPDYGTTPTNFAQVRSNNDYYQTRNNGTYVSTELQVDPQFINEPPFTTELTDATESVLDNYDFMPGSTSPMLGAGIYIPTLTTDANGVTRPNPPAIGALDAESGNTQSASQITLTATPNPVTVGDSVTLSASIASVNGVIPTGTVSFTSNGTALGSGVVNSAGTATLTVSLSAAGSDALIAAYSGDTTYAPGASPALSLTVSPAPAVETTTLLQASSSPVTAGQSITLTATVAAGSGGTPSGAVSFLSNGAILGTASLSSAGVATLSTASLAAGSYSLTAQYAGNSSFDASTSSPLSVTVNPAPAVATTTRLQASSNPITAGQSITLTATVAAGSGGTPSGTVSFLSNGAILGTASLSSAGVATLSTASLAAGSYSLTAQYAGNSSFDASSSSPLSVTVNPAAGEAAGIVVAASTPTLTMGSGTSTSDAEVLTLTAVGGYSGTITMACANLPSGSTCSFQPPTVSVNAATSPVTVVMTIQNSGTSTTASLGTHSAMMRGTTLAAIFWIPGLFASALIGKKRKLLFQAKFLLILLLLGGVFGGLTGCGGASYTAITQAAQTTPFQVMVSGTGNVSETISLTVTIQ